MPITLPASVTIAVLLALWTLVAPQAWSQEQPDTVEVTYVVKSQWSDGFTADLTIRNNTARPIEDWQLSFQFSPHISRIWNARIISQTDTEYLIGPARWDEDALPAGKSLTVGFVASGSAPALPSEAYLNSAPIRFNALSPAPPARHLRAVPAPAWPRAAFSPYVDATIWPQLDLLAVAKELDVHHFRLGFVVARSATDPTPTWGSARSATSSYRLREINALRILGGDVAIAFGGQAGTELAAVATSGADLATRYHSVIDAYGARVIDFDLEGAALTDRNSIQLRAEALLVLQQRMAAEQRPLEIWLTLPLLPTGLTADGVQVIRSAIEHGVRIRGINGMAMDFGDAAAPQPSGRMGAYATQGARSLHDQLRTLYAASHARPNASDLWQMISITPMIGRNDVPAEKFELSDADQLLRFASGNRIGSLSMWSLNRDRPCEHPDPAVSPLCSGISQHPYEFARVLRPFDVLGQ